MPRAFRGVSLFVVKPFAGLPRNHRVGEHDLDGLTADQIAMLRRRGYLTEGVGAAAPAPRKIALPAPGPSREALPRVRRELAALLAGGGEPARLLFDLKELAHQEARLTEHLIGCGEAPEPFTPSDLRGLEVAVAAVQSLPSRSDPQSEAASLCRELEVLAVAWGVELESRTPDLPPVGAVGIAGEAVRLPGMVGA